jgi:hypothetical protein
MRAPVVDRETAEAEINAWLESKKVFPSSLEDNEDAVKLLIEAIMYGALTYDAQTNQLTQKLMFAFGEEGVEVTELKYKHRINDKILQKYMKGISPKDGDGRLNATIAGLTDKARGIIEGLDTIDKKVANAIATFFF